MFIFDILVGEIKTHLVREKQTLSISDVVVM